jgi:hypothetical protein
MRGPRIPPTRYCNHNVASPLLRHADALAARGKGAPRRERPLKIKAPRGTGWLTNPKRALYNRVYRRTTVDGVKVIAKLLK